MSRRGRSKVKQALTGSFATGITNAITELHSRMASHDRYVLTDAEFLTMFVEPHLHEHWAIVAQEFYQQHVTSEFGYAMGHTGITRVDVINLKLEINNINFLPLPNFKVLHASEEFKAWITRRVNLAFDFGRVGKVFSILNAALVSPPQLRYYWPAIMTLAEVAGASATDRELVAYPDGRRAPPLPPGLRRACQDTAALITGAALVDPQKRVQVPLEITFETWRNHQTLTEDGLGMFAMNAVA